MKTYGQGLIVTSQSAIRAGVMRFEIPVNGTITEVRVALDPGQPVNNSGDTIFDGNLNGVTIFGDQTTRPRIVAGARVGIVSLGVPCTKGQVFTLDIDTPAPGGTGAPIFATVTIEDGIGIRGDVQHTTAVIGAGGSADAEIPLGKGGNLYRIQVSAAARVRLYSTQAAREADRTRPPTVDPVGESGVLLDVNLPAGNLDFHLVNMPGFFRLPEAAEAVVPNIPAIITNNSGGGVAITVTITRVITEG